MRWLVLSMLITASASADTLDSLRLFYSPSERAHAEREVSDPPPMPVAEFQPSKRGWIDSGSWRIEIPRKSHGRLSDRRLIIGRSP